MISIIIIIYSPRLFLKFNAIFSVSSKPCKVVYKYMEDGTKVRVSKRSGCVIPKPPDLADRKDFKSRSGYLGIII